MYFHVIGPKAIIYQPEEDIITMSHSIGKQAMVILSASKGC
jgi:hypothetical protein